MGRLLLRWVILAASVVIASFVTQALGLKFYVTLRHGSDYIELLIGVAILAFANATFGRIIKFITLPLNCLTLGLFSLVVNAIVLLVVASLDIGFKIEGSPMGKFISAFVGSVVISLVNGLLEQFVPDKDEDE